MIQRSWTLVGGLMALAAATGIAGCSSADDPEGETGGTSGTSTGGSSGSATGGSSGTDTGGSTATGGTSGTATGGTSGTSTGGTAGTGQNPAECRGISRDAACDNVGLDCPELVCGLADSGRRSCQCTGTWSCTSCDYSGAWTETMPDDVQPCPSGVAREVPCTTEMAICGPQANGQYCACWNDPSDGLSWDCDSPPTSWGI